MSVPPELRPPRKGERYLVDGELEAAVATFDHDGPDWVIVEDEHHPVAVGSGLNWDVIRGTADARPVDPVPADPAAPAEFKRCFQFAPYGGRPAEIAERHADVYPGQVWECTVTPTRRIDSEASVCPVAPSGPSESPTTAHELPDRKWNLP
jgi:hypothetical protein